jgi:glycogen operon protein
MTTLLLSQGVPMILGGDELGRSQGGNNNGYCQDNEISWYDWHDVDVDFDKWCRRVIAFRREHPVFRRRRWFQGRLIRGIEDLAWLRPDGEEMTDEDWETGYARAVGVFLNGATIPTPDSYGARVLDDNYLVLFNAGHEALAWQIPGPQWSRRWTIDLDTSDPRRGWARTVNVRPGDEFQVLDRSMVVLRSTRPPARHPSTKASRPRDPSTPDQSAPDQSTTAQATPDQSTTTTDQATTDQATPDQPEGHD